MGLAYRFTVGELLFPCIPFLSLLSKVPMAPFIDLDLSGMHVKMTRNIWKIGMFHNDEDDDDDDDKPR